ncbi:MAG TPA: glycosyltransferase family 39 protein [Chloroflexota bacterium]|nr:glycosyltransferase family 39 protein [Chloroflexota bacterium]
MSRVDRVAPAAGAGQSLALTRTAWSWLALVAPLAAALALGLLSLLRTPPPFIDEVWFANRAWGFVQTGLNFGTLDEGVWNRFDGYWTYFPWLPTYFVSLAFEAFGLSLFSLRLTSLVFGLVLLVALYAIAERLGGRRLAVLTVVLVSLSRAFVYSSHLGRPDIMGAAFGFGAIALYVCERSSRFPLATALAGFAVGLAFESHPFGSIYGPMIAVLFLLDYGWRVLWTRRLWAFGLGAVAGLAFYAGLHILPYPQTYLAINGIAALASGAVRTPPLINPDPAVWLQSAIDMALQFGLLWNVRIPFVLAGAVLLWRSGARSDRRLLAICAVVLVAYFGLIRNKNPWYAVMAAPAGDLLAAVVLERLARTRLSDLAAGMPFFDWKSLSAVWQPLRWAAVAALVAVLAVPTLARTVESPLGDYQLTLDRIRQTVRPGSSVVGPATYWFGLTEERYVSWEQLVYYRRYAPGSTVTDGMRALEADYFISDPYIEKFFRDTPRQSVNAQQLLLPKSEVDAFLAQRARLAAVIETDTYGAVKVYQIDRSR